MPSSLDLAWQQQSSWSQVGDRLKRTLQRRRWANLVLTIAGSVLSVTAANVGLSSAPGKAFAAAAGFCLGVATIVQTVGGTAGVRDWTRARSIAEALKSEIYLARAGYAAPDFDDTVKRIIDAGDDLRAHLAGIEPQTRDLPPVHNTETYLDVRVGRQIDTYYRPRAARLATVVKVYRSAEIILGVLAVGLTVVAGTWEIDWLATWVPVVTTVTAAVVAHAAAERSSYQLVEYVRTRDELSRVLHRAGENARLTDEQLVRHAEAVISAQNEGWMAKLSGDLTT